MKIDKPLMFTTFTRKYLVYQTDRVTEFLTLSSANFHRDLVSGYITEALYIGKELVQEIEL